MPYLESGVVGCLSSEVNDKLAKQITKISLHDVYAVHILHIDYYYDYIIINHNPFPLCSRENVPGSNSLGECVRVCVCVRVC